MRRTSPRSGALLSVEQVLEGSVRTAGGRLRVTAQLSDVATGYQLWSERFDRGSEDVFAVQDEIAQGCRRCGEGPARFGRARRRRPAAGWQPRGLPLLPPGSLSPAHQERPGGALRAFEEAVRLDPSHGPSWVGVAEATGLAAHYGLIPARPAYARVKQVLTTAHELQGESADALYVEAFCNFMAGDWPAAEAAYGRALDLQPRHVHALGSYGFVLCTRNRFDEGMTLLSRARETDPLAAFPYAMTGFALIATRRAQESDRYFEDALSFENENALALWGSCVARVALGRFEQALATAEQGVAVTRRGAFFVGLLGWALAAAGRKDDARVLLEELRARPADVPTVVSEAWLLALLDEQDAAFEVLARGRRAPVLPPLLRAPRLRSASRRPEVRRVSREAGPASKAAAAPDGRPSARSGHQGSRPSEVIGVTRPGSSPGRRAAGAPTGFSNCGTRSHRVGACPQSSPEMHTNASSRGCAPAHS